MLTTVPRVSSPVRWVVAVVLLGGLALRLAVLGGMTGTRPAIRDERDYQQLALNLMEYGEFSFEPGRPTSSRPPLYPGIMAGLWQLTGTTNPQVVRSAQIVLHMALAFMVYVVGIRVFSRGVAAAAALACWWYPAS